MAPMSSSRTCARVSWIVRTVDTTRCATNPRLIYCQVTGYGADVPDRDRAAYDIGAFWSRAGVRRLADAAGQPIPSSAAAWAIT